ncbi:MAG TPA: allantoicase [Gemmatimonadales bacterium]|jgi:allantoicase
MNDFLSLTDLAAERLGGAVIAANDEFFAEKENLVKAAAPVWKEGLYNDRGKWMDGWETRRRRDPGYDWAIIRLGLPGAVRGVVVDTAFFTGNYPEACAVEACELAGVPDAAALETAVWAEILPRTLLKGDSKNVFPTTGARRTTHLRLNIFPDGGVARLRVHGDVLPDWESILRPGGWVDLGALEHAGRVVGQSDMFYGDANNMLRPGRSTHMGDGWETKRRRGEGHDWAIVKLGHRGTVRRIEIDTDHFRGNAPGSCSLDGTTGDDPAQANWTSLLGLAKLQPHARHLFEKEITAVDGLTHVRLNIRPDGGIARLRLFGTVTAPAR